MAYALRNEGKVVGLFTNRENAEEYMREASGGPDGHDLAIDDEPMTVVAPQYLDQHNNLREIRDYPALLNVITYRVGDELRECCVRDRPWFAAAQAMVMRGDELAGTPEPGQPLESITTFYPDAGPSDGRKWSMLPLSPAANSVLEIVTTSNLDVLAGLLLQPLLAIDSDSDIPRYLLTRLLEIPRDTPISKMRQRLSSVTLDDLRAHPQGSMNTVRAAKEAYDYHVAYFGDSHEFLLSSDNLGDRCVRIDAYFDAASDNVDRVACVIALARLFPELEMPPVICADAVDAFASGEMREAVRRVMHATR